jgi:glutamate-1-semialdehyde 2,1-aminomutase
MQLLADRRVFHGGVYSGNAAVMAAAEAVLDDILAHRETIYTHLHALAREFCTGLREILGRLGVPHVVQSVGPMISLFLTHAPVDRLTDYREVQAQCDFEKYIRFQHHLQRAGIYFHPNMFEPMFLSTAHTQADVAEALAHIEEGARCTLAG